MTNSVQSGQSWLRFIFFNGSFVVMNYQFVNGLMFTIAGILAAQNRRADVRVCPSDPDGLKSAAFHPRESLKRAYSRLSRQPISLARSSPTCSRRSRSCAAGDAGGTVQRPPPEANRYRQGS